MAADTKDMNDERAVKASAEETKAAAEGDMANAVKDMADSTKRSEVAAVCMVDCPTDSPLRRALHVHRTGGFGRVISRLSPLALTPVMGVPWPAAQACPRRRMQAVPPRGHFPG